MPTDTEKYVIGSEPYEAGRQVITANLDAVSLQGELDDLTEYQLWLRTETDRNLYFHINYCPSEGKIDSFTIFDSFNTGAPQVCYMFNPETSHTSTDPSVNAAEGVPSSLLAGLHHSNPYPPAGSFWGYRANPDSPIMVVLVWQANPDAKPGWKGPDFSQGMPPRPMSLAVFFHESLDVTAWSSDLWDPTPAVFARLIKAGKIVSLDQVIANATEPVNWLTTTKSFAALAWPKLATDCSPTPGKYYSLRDTSPGHIYRPSDKALAKAVTTDLRPGYASNEKLRVVMKQQLSP